MCLPQIRIRLHQICFYRTNLMRGKLAVMMDKRWTAWLVVVVVGAALLGIATATAKAVRQAKHHHKLKPHESKITKREHQRALRRHQKDARLATKKQAAAVARIADQQGMSEEQKREQMERIKMQRVEQYQKLDMGLASGLRVVVDMAFAERQTERECHSVLKQLGCVYGYMKKCPLDMLISLRVASYTDTIASLGSRHGVPSWKIHIHTETVDTVYDADKLVYLSPDADEALTELDSDCVYVVGGIVDRSVRKGQTLAKATVQGVSVRRLPLQEFMHVHKPVLNIDAVLIALNEFANHRDWVRAFDVAIPKRMATSTRQTAKSMI